MMSGRPGFEAIQGGRSQGLVAAFALAAIVFQLLLRVALRTTTELARLPLDILP